LSFPPHPGSALPVRLVGAPHCYEAGTTKKRTVPVLVPASTQVGKLAGSVLVTATHDQACIALDILGCQEFSLNHPKLPLIFIKQKRELTFLPARDTAPVIEKGGIRILFMWRCPVTPPGDRGRILAQRKKFSSEAKTLVLAIALRQELANGARENVDGGRVVLLSIVFSSQR
jgi:hypothetical protein